MKKELLFATYTVANADTELLKDDVLQEILLPVIDKNQPIATNVDPSNHQKSRKRTGKGAHSLSVARELISDRKRWFDIKSIDDYKFPGIFNARFPQRLGYCEDISKLCNYEADRPNFPYSDIRFGKGKVRQQNYPIEMKIDGKMEKVYYRFAPCGGVKRCAKFTEGCSYVVHTNECKRCSQHPNSELEHSEECPVEFFYICPEDGQDNRRWLTGLVRTGNLQASNLHNHPHPEMLMKIDTDIQRGVVESPHLETSDVLTSM